MLRIVLVVFTAGVLVFALNNTSTMYEMVQNAYKVTLVGAFVPLVCGIYWKRATTQGALALGAWRASPSGSSASSSSPRPRCRRRSSGLVASLVGMVVGSLAPQLVRDGRAGPTQAPRQPPGRAFRARLFRISSLSPFAVPVRVPKVRPCRDARGDSDQRRSDDEQPTNSSGLPSNAAVAGAVTVLAAALVRARGRARSSRDDHSQAHASRRPRARRPCPTVTDIPAEARADHRGRGAPHRRLTASLPQEVSFARRQPGLFSGRARRPPESAFRRTALPERPAGSRYTSRA